MSIEAATGQTMQGNEQSVESRIEEALFGEPEGDGKKEVSEGDKRKAAQEAVLTDLPDDDDSDLDDDDGLDDEVIEPGEEEDDDELTLSDYLGVDEDRIIEKDDGIFMKAIIDGEEKEVPLKELAVSYQLQGHVNNKSIALENERKEFEEVRSQVSQAAQMQMQELGVMMTIAEQQLVGEFNNIDWDALRAEDPANWAALKEEFSERATKTQQLKGVMLQKMQEQKEAHEKEFQKKRSSHLKEELDKLIMANPEWADASKLEAAQGKIRNFVKEQYGFTDEDMQFATDHRLIALIQDSMAYHEAKKGAEGKREKEVPEFAKPGGNKKKAANAANARRVKAKKTALKKSGSIDDAAALLTDRM